MWVKGEKDFRKVSSHELPRIGEKIMFSLDSGDSKNWEPEDQLYEVTEVVHPTKREYPSPPIGQGTHIPNVWVEPVKKLWAGELKVPDEG